MALLREIRKHLLAATMGITLLALPGFGQERYTLIEDSDAVEKSKTMEWSATAETGEQDLAWQAAHEGLETLLVLSPDTRFLLLGQPVESGLDVVAYKLFPISFTDKSVWRVAEVALSGTFAPTSDYLFISTGPHPILYNLATRKATPLTEIESGLENYPVWVSSWSADGKELVIRQQQRFDSAAEPRSCTLRIE
jgi:hypothetical protein